ITYLLFFLCPVMYFSEQVYYRLIDRPYGRIFYAIYHLNPVAMLVTAYRKTLLAPQPFVHDGISQAPIPLNWKLFGITAAMSVFTLWYGYRVFNKLKWRFVERV
ncbi:MAG: lipopolysaccharide transport system permease protein, partial [Fimbriimonadaceae bacterium]|nr:lipopolysaccharide transport system permease protein [Fimbriimonadaceae bacterium]